MPIIVESKLEQYKNHHYGRRPGASVKIRADANRGRFFICKRTMEALAWFLMKDLSITPTPVRLCSTEKPNRWVFDFKNATGSENDLILAPVTKGKGKGKGWINCTDFFGNVCQRNGIMGSASLKLHWDPTTCHFWFDLNPDEFSVL